jgi:hypothetical protein
MKKPLIRLFCGKPQKIHLPLREGFAERPKPFPAVTPFAVIKK